MGTVPERRGGADTDNAHTPGRRGRTWASVLLCAALVYAVGISVERQDAASHGARSYQPHVAARGRAGAFETRQIPAGRRWSLADHQGHVVLINFFATWCPPCRAETPDLVRAAETYGARGLDVVAVNMDGSGNADAAIRAYVEEYHVPYPITTSDSLGEAMLRMGLLDGGGGMALPTSVFVDRQGRVASVHVGALSPEDLSTEIEPLLAEPAPVEKADPAQAAAQRFTSAAR